MVTETRNTYANLLGGTDDHRSLGDRYFLAVDLEGDELYSLVGTHRTPTSLNRVVFS